MDGELQSMIDELVGAMNAQKFALENLWAFVLREAGATSVDAIATGNEMLRQFEDLPPRFEGADPARVLPVLQFGVDHLERMWGNIAARLDQA